MAMRAAESGGKKLLPNGQVRAEPLPSRLYAVRRVCKSHQVKKKRREEKKRNKHSAQARARREQRAQERAAKQAAMQARKLEKRERRVVKQAALQAQRLEKHERRAAKQAALQANREQRKATPRPPVNQSALGSPRQEAQAGSKGSQTSQVNPVRIPSLVAKRTEAVPRLAFARWSPPAAWQARATAIGTPRRFLEPTPSLDCATSSKRGSSSSALPRTSPAATEARTQGNSPKEGSWTPSTSGSMNKPTREKSGGQVSPGAFQMCYAF